MKIMFQIGYQKNLRGGQVLEVSINDTPLEIESEDGGQYLTALSSRRTDLWYLKPVELEDEDVIRVEAKVGLRGLGPDESRCFIAILHPKKDVRGILNHMGVGFGKGFPLASGEFEIVAFQTKEEERYHAGLDKLKNI